MFTNLYESEDIVMAESFGVRYPAAFGHPAAEYAALTGTAAILDLCHWGVLRVTGDDRIRLLNSLTTNDVAVLDTGAACHSALTTVKGKLVAELYVLRREAELMVLVAQGDHHTVAATIDKHIVADDVVVADESDATGVLSVEGPAARGVLWRLLPEAGQIPDRRLRFVDTHHLGVPVTVLVSSVSGEDGYQLIIPSGGIHRVRDYLVQSARADDAGPAGLVAWNIRRVEAGLPWWGVDVTPGENFPKECRFDDVVNYEKGCYLGQETLARMHHRGHPNWSLVGMTPVEALPGVETPPLSSCEDRPRAAARGDSVADAVRALDLSPVVPPGTELFAGDGKCEAAGRITSAVFSAKLQKPLLLGYVRSRLAGPGTMLELPVDGHRCRVTVVPLPVE